LLDRMEIIELSGYTGEEKREIAKRYLIPKKVRANGLSEEEITFDDGAIDEICQGYTREAGVRNLERKIDAVCRKVAVNKADGKSVHAHITAENVAEYLGAARYERGDE